MVAILSRPQCVKAHINWDELLILDVAFGTPMKWDPFPVNYPPKQTGNSEYWFGAGVVLILNTLMPRQNGRHFSDNILKCIFLNENVWILIEISLKFVPNRGPINNIPALVDIEKVLQMLILIAQCFITQYMIKQHIFMHPWVKILKSEQNGYHFANSISKAISWKEIVVFWLKFQLIVFLGIQATRSQRYLNQSWSNLLMNLCHGPQWVNSVTAVIYCNIFLAIFKCITL